MNNMDKKKGELTIDDFRNVVEIIRKDIISIYKKQNYKRLFSIIDSYAVLNQTVNIIFRDDAIEKVLKDVGEKVIGASTQKVVTNKKIVFYDQIGTTICLGLQYLRGLVADGYDILYIFEHPERKVNKSMLDEARQACSKVLVYEQKSTIVLAKEIQSEIEKFGASKLICHCPADGAMANSIFYSIPNVERFRIVPGDHHYYIGLDCIDHFLEFRKFSIKVAAEERQIPLEKIYKLPYYPIISSFCDFQGFPEEANGKVKILAAGSEYKFHGSDWFFETSKWILKNHENTVIIFLGGKSAQVVNFVEDNELNDRFLLLGYRKDFVECMKHADMFLNSYPMGGGLVGLTAINLLKPVISHFDDYNGLQNSIRGFLGAEDVDSPISFKDDKLMKEYITRLVDDSLYREREALRMKGMAQTKEMFDNMLSGYLNGELPHVAEIPTESCHLDKRVESYIKLQNEFLPTVLNMLIKIYGITFIMRFPFLKGFVLEHFRVVLGWYLGMKTEYIFSPKIYKKAKLCFKKFFV